MNQLVTSLKPCRGQGTTLVSIYVAANSNMNLNNKLHAELKTCENIKDAKIRKPVQRALKMAQAKMSGMKHLPSTGLALFSGQLV